MKMAARPLKKCRLVLRLQETEAQRVNSFWQNRKFCDLGICYWYTGIPVRQIQGLQS